MNYFHLIIICICLFWIYNSNIQFYNKNPFYKYLKKKKLSYITKYKNICTILNIFFKERTKFKLSYKEVLININEFLNLYSKIKLNIHKNIKVVEKKNEILRLKSLKKIIMLNLHSICYNVSSNKYQKYIKFEKELFNILNNIINSLYNKDDLNSILYPISWNEITDQNNLYI